MTNYSNNPNPGLNSIQANAIKVYETIEDLRQDVMAELNAIYLITGKDGNVNPKYVFYDNTKKIYEVGKEDWTTFNC